MRVAYVWIIVKLFKGWDQAGYAYSAEGPVGTPEIDFPNPI